MLKDVIVLVEILFSLLVVIVVIIFIYHYTKYNSKGFNRKGIHKNGTKYDDFGYDVRGFDKSGYNQQGYDVNGYDGVGYNRQGYNRCGKNAKGQYNRLFDTYYSEDGFRNPQLYPISVTDHARERMIERMHIQNVQDVKKIAFDAYCYGRSKRQIKKSSTVMIEEIESRHKGCVLLVYSGYIYIFSDDNKLITVYKNDRIPL